MSSNTPRCLYKGLHAVRCWRHSHTHTQPNPTICQPLGWINVCPPNNLIGHQVDCFNSRHDCGGERLHSFCWCEEEERRCPSPEFTFTPAGHEPRELHDCQHVCVCMCMYHFTEPSVPHWNADLRLRKWPLPTAMSCSWPALKEANRTLTDVVLRHGHLPDLNVDGTFRNLDNFHISWKRKSRSRY